MPCLPCVTELMTDDCVIVYIYYITEVGCSISSQLGSGQILSRQPVRCGKGRRSISYMYLRIFAVLVDTIISLKRYLYTVSNYISMNKKHVREFNGHDMDTLVF